MQESIQIQDVFNMIKKRLFLIVSITMLSVMISGLVTYFWLTPIYEASTQLLINQKNSDQQSQRTIDVQENLELINTYRVIIKSPFILDIVKSELNLKRSIKDLGEQIKISNEQNSQVVTITVQDPDPETAVEIANAISTIFMNEIPSIMNIDNVTILSLANEESSSEPVKPRLLINMLIAFTFSLLFIIGIVILFEYLDDTIKSEQTIRSFLELPVLGSIPYKKTRDYENGIKKNRKKLGWKERWSGWHFLKRKQSKVKEKSLR